MSDETKETEPTPEPTPEHHSEPEPEHRAEEHHDDVPARVSALETTVATLQGTVDGLLAAPKVVEPERDSTPVRKPWTHRFSRTTIRGDEQ